MMTFIPIIISGLIILLGGIGLPIIFTMKLYIHFQRQLKQEHERQLTEAIKELFESYSTKRYYIHTDTNKTGYDA